jgi:hypothetical protein
MILVTKLLPIPWWFLVELDLSVRRVERERATGTPWLWPASRDPHRLPLRLSPWVRRLHFFLVTGGGAGTSVSGGKSPCSFLLPANQMHLTIVRIPRFSTLVTVIFGPPDFNSTRSPILNATVPRSFTGDLRSYLKKPRNLYQFSEVLTHLGITARAHSAPAAASIRPELGAKRTYRRHRKCVAFDPLRTSNRSRARRMRKPPQNGRRRLSLYSSDIGRGMSNVGR